MSGGCKKSAPPPSSSTAASAVLVDRTAPQEREKAALAETQKFLDQGGQANAKDDLGTTRLMGAAVDDFPAVAALLIAKGADVKSTDDSLGQTALHFCATGHGDRVAALLLEKGADPNARDHRGQTPLHVAASSGNVALVKLLLAKGAEVKARDQVNQTPLHRAASGGQIAVAELLVAAGADPNAEAARGRTPLDVARVAGQTKMVAWLQAKGAHGAAVAVKTTDEQKPAPIAATTSAQPTPPSSDLDRTKPQAVAEGFLKALKAGDFHKADQYVLERDLAGWRVNYPVMHQRLPDRLEISCSKPEPDVHGTYVSVTVKGCSLAPDLKLINGQWWVVYTR